MSNTSEQTPPTTRARIAARLVQGVAALRSLVAPVVRESRARVEQQLHPRRRRQAIAQVRQLRPRTVLMVCLGNICRSPYAAALLAQTARGTGITIDSGGFIGPGRPSPPNAQAAALQLGTDLTMHRSKVLTPELLQAHDLTVVMEAAQARTLISKHGVPAGRILVLGDLDPLPIQSRTIVDPYGGSPDVFTHCYERVQRCVHALASIVTDGPRADIRS